MYLELDDTSCCGMDEISGLNDKAIDTVKDFCHLRYIRDYDQSIVLFSDAVKNKRGVKLAKFIKENKLGSIVETPTRLNRNSGNKIKAWLWTPSNKELRKFYNKHKKEIGKLDGDSGCDW